MHICTTWKKTSVVQNSLVDPLFYCWTMMLKTDLGHMTIIIFVYSRLSVHRHYWFRSDQESTFEAELPLCLTYWFASQTSLRVYKLLLLDENKLEAVLIPLVGILSMGPNWSYYRIRLFQKSSRCSRCSTLELLCSKYVSGGLWVPAAICSYGSFLTIPYCL